MYRSLNLRYKRNNKYTLKKFVPAVHLMSILRHSVLPLRILNNKITKPINLNYFFRSAPITNTQPPKNPGRWWTSHLFYPIKVLGWLPPRLNQVEPVTLGFIPTQIYPTCQWSCSCPMSINPLSHWMGWGEAALEVCQKINKILAIIKLCN